MESLIPDIKAEGSEVACSDYQFKVLAVDDQSYMIDTLKIVLGKRVAIVGATSARTALDLIRDHDFDVVITDYSLGDESGLSGLDIFKAALEKNFYVVPCLMTGHENVELMKKIFDVFHAHLVQKPFSKGAFNRLFELACRNVAKRLEAEGRTSSDDALTSFVAESPNMKKILQQIRRTADFANLSVHIAGPTGSGKSALAKAIYQLSGCKGPFRAVNCAEIQPELAESILFGHVKGAFTGAVSDTEGVIAAADTGVLFLDELHLLPKQVQGKLLRVLQDGTYTRLGDKKERQSQFRIISAASSNVRELASNNDFSPDLWYRISNKTISVPPLRERKACIPKLVFRFLNQISTERGRIFEIEADAMDLLVSFSWEGNIHDLRNSILSLCSEAIEDRITANLVNEDLKSRIGTLSATETLIPLGDSLPQITRKYEIRLILQVLNATNGNIQKAADRLGVKRTTLSSRLRTLGIKI